MSSGKDHAPHPTTKSIAGDMIQNDFRAGDANAVTAGFYPDSGENSSHKKAQNSLWFLCLFVASFLEQILQCELHDPGVFRARHSSEQAATHINDRIVQARGVSEVKRFRPEFDPLRFT